MSTVPDVLKSLFSSTLRIKVFSHYFAHPGESFYVRELAEILGEFAGNVARELKNLEQSGLLNSTTRGERKYYALNSSSPIIDDLRSIFQKTVDFENELTGVNTGTGEKADGGGNDKPAVVLTAEEEAIFLAIRDEGSSAENLCVDTALSAAVVQRNLIMLKLKGCIRKSKRGLYHHLS